ncbi:MAG: histidine kinase dimerization/phospho-acceptor domain-containing protein [Spirochaetaceae bacterium]|nr:histidine kinase dimerization/phospho-acceptor domain-containing protein [Spirochaetaceae bacterium]MDT8298392.1 histidine kinase dimerization/phospho-acceptor domain-containing protein [Spirochaetaceae bacterium]
MSDAHPVQRWWIGLMALIILFIWALTGWYLVRDRREQLAFAKASSKMQVQILAEHTAALFRQIELGLRAYPWTGIEDTAPANHGGGGCPSLRRTMLDIPGLDNAVIMTADGSIYCSLHGRVEAGFPREALLMRHRDELLGFSIIPSAEERNFLTLGIRLDDEQGLFAGVLAATVPVDYFTSRFRSYGTVNAEMIALYDEEQEVLVRWPVLEATQEICAEPLLAGVPESELISGGLLSLETENAVLAMFQLPGFAYRIVIATSKGMILEPWRAHLVIILGSALLLSVTIISASTWIRTAEERKRRADTELAASRTREQEAKINRLEGLRALAGGLAHDINNRMMVVLGNSQLLESLPAGDTDVLKSIQQAARRTSKLSEQMLFAAGHTPMAVSTVDVVEAIAAHEPRLRKLVGEDAELVIDAGSESLPVTGEVRLIISAIRKLVEKCRRGNPHPRRPHCSGNSRSPYQGFTRRLLVRRDCRRYIHGDQCEGQRRRYSSSA